MRYFLDTEFNEGIINPVFSKPYHTIDLISVGIASEDHRTYYAINKEFDIHRAWYKADISYKRIGDNNMQTVKTYWLRENVLWPIFWQLILKDDPTLANGIWSTRTTHSGYKEFSYLVKKYGKSKAEIGKEIFEFCKGGEFTLTEQHALADHDGGPKVGDISTRTDPEFWGYYCDYDWVAICGGLYGSMMKLPATFPMYCRDLKQMYDEIQAKRNRYFKNFTNPDGMIMLNTDMQPLEIKKLPDYPKQDKEHTADDDAAWNMELYQFLSKWL